MAKRASPASTSTTRKVPRKSVGRETGRPFEEVRERIGIDLPDILRRPDHVENLFESSRAGTPVVRPDDLLALRIQLVNLVVAPGSPPRLRAHGNGKAMLVLHYPPQSIAEEVFFETPPVGVSEAAADRPPSPRVDASLPAMADRNVEPPPVRARAAGESRVIFEWPDGFECDYTLAGVLEAVQSMAMSVPPGALPRQTRLHVLPWPEVIVIEPVVPVGRRARRPSRSGAVVSEAGVVRARDGTTATTLASFSLRQTTIALRGGPAAEATLARRLSDIAGGLVLDPSLDVELIRPRGGPRPAMPRDTETALELPWRLIVSPHAAERWRHAPQAVTSAATQRTELWHSRLVGAATLRAVWATTNVWGKPMQGAYPTITDLPLPGRGDPFLPTLNDYDRYQISHLSANFSQSNYAPQPVETNLVMLSSLGAWLDARGDWDPPGLDVESWVHRATMGRDHYVRVVYRGVLFPFGHRAVLIKVSERKFHRSLPGNPAYLRQRMFMVVRERERRYDDAAGLQPYGAGSHRVQNEFPFTHVRMLTTVTPDLDQPDATDVGSMKQLLFWPAVGGAPFRFRMSATDLDGRNVEFELPAIFMSNSLASPRRSSGGRLVPLYTGSNAGLTGAAEWATLALEGWNERQTPDAEPEPRATDWTFAAMRHQRVALAPSATPGDTAIEAVTMTFGAHVPQVGTAASVNAFKTYSNGLTRPMFFPRVVRAQARIAALAQLSGSDKLNLVRWNPTFAEKGFDGSLNKGEVFVDVVETSDMAKLDFSRQGDRSGGFVMPNMQPSALSRALGPAAGNVADLLAGTVKPEQFFPPTAMGALPLPLLFGCIPLSAVIREVGDLLGNLDKVPKFVSEASTKVESFFGDIMRLYQLVTALAQQPASLADAAVAVAKERLADLAQQSVAFGATQASAVSALVTAVQAELETLHAQMAALYASSFVSTDPLAGIDLSNALDAPQGNGRLRAALVALRDGVAAAPGVQAGFRQQVNAAVDSSLTLLGSIAAFAGLYAPGKALFDALKDLVDNPAPGQSIGELMTQPAALAPKIQAVADRLGGLRTGVASVPLLDGPPRKSLLDILDTVKNAFDAVPDLLTMLENLLGEELVIRFDWKPEIKSWGFDPAAPLFVVHDPHAFIVTVEARVKKSGGPPKIRVLCGLHHFDLVLIAPASFIELNFEKIEFSVDSAAKTNVDVLLTDIKFVGPLSFVETLRDLIPLDGFSDPPHLDITPQGIDAGFSVSLPSLAIGLFNLSNLSLGAGFTVPFIGQPLSVRFNFCTREQPFLLTVSMFGGGGFFGVTLDPHGVQILEAAFEFGAAISIDFGVASGGVSVMAGIYFRMESNAASLAGYFRLAGHVDVLGLITASLELYLELRYEFETGKAAGRASLTIEISVFVFSGSVTISCERKFAGSNGDPTFRQLMGLSADPALALADELAAIADDTAYAWRDYCEAFA